VPHHDEDVSRELLRGGAVPRHQDLSAGLRLLHQRGKDGSGPQGPECRQGERMMMPRRSGSGFFESGVRAMLNLDAGPDPYLILLMTRYSKSFQLRSKTVNKFLPLAKQRRRV
jgi:hypothetical protein